MGRWVVCFNVCIDELCGRLGREIPRLPYAQLCDWLQDQLVYEMKVYPGAEPVEDSRDGQEFGLRFEVHNDAPPKVKSRYFEVTQVLPWNDVYDENE